MTDRVDHQEAFVLHTHPYRETSLIVEAFSRDSGRVSLVARGARRPMSGIKARLIPFQPLWLSWFGKGALHTLHAAEWQGGDLHLAGSALMCGFYLNELLLKLLPAGDAHPALFERYQSTLTELNAGSDPEPILRRFELALLSELGYAQPLGHETDGSTLLPERRYAYAFDEGVHEALRDEPSYAGKTLIDMASGDFSDPSTQAESKALMRALINHYLAGKPLLTRQLLRDMQAL